METEKFQELVLHKLDSLTTGQEKLEGRMEKLDGGMVELQGNMERLNERVERLEHTVDIIKEETAGLMEFRTQTAVTLKKFEDVEVSQRVMSEILGDHEIQIRKLQKRLA